MQNDRKAEALVLGGGGGMGRYAARTLAGLGHRVTVADRDGGLASRTAEECGAGARGVSLDVTVAAELSAALRAADVVLNAVGPYFRFGPLVLRAAIEARCDYLDLCDDPEPTLAMLALDGEARAAGVRVVIGMGASPGISNLLAVDASRQLDETHRLVTGWNGEGAVPEPGAGPAAVVHGIEQATGTVWVVRDGELAQERPLRPVELAYPGVGRRRVRTFGHPEPVTLHRPLGVAESVNVTHGRRRFEWPLVALGRLVDRGVISAERAAAIGHRAERLAPSPPLAALARPDRLPPLFALAEGRRDDRPATAAAALAATPGVTMGAVTGVPFGVAADLILRDRGPEPGVHAPETAFDPDLFFAEFARHCQGPAREVRVITRSWEAADADRYRDAILRFRAGA